jgi:hypothetical protein
MERELKGREGYKRSTPPTSVFQENPEQRDSKAVHSRVLGRRVGMSIKRV